MKTAIVTGICGQDGAYLAKHLLDHSYHVVGWARRNANTDGLRWLGIDRHVQISYVDICDPFHVADEIIREMPEEIYNLAAQSHVGMSFKNPILTCQVNYGGYLNILLAARRHMPECRIYQAGTSEMYGYASDKAANEQTPFAPMSPYAISKVAAHWAGVNARFEADQFVCNGILFNHESPIRGVDFVTRKITQFVAQYSKHGGTLSLGNLDAVRDWGFAGDYVKAMHAMMQRPWPDDYVIASGRTMTVRTFAASAFLAAGKQIEFAGEGAQEQGFVDGKLAVVVSPEYYRPNDLTYLKGDASKAAFQLEWKPEMPTEKLIEDMVRADSERMQ